MNLVIELTEFQALTPADGVLVSQMRQNLNPHKGLVNGPAMREQFDTLIASTPAATGVTYVARPSTGLLPA
jgi:hypothetical protein